MASKFTGPKTTVKASALRPQADGAKGAAISKNSLYKKLRQNKVGSMQVSKDNQRLSQTLQTIKENQSSNAKAQGKESFNINSRHNTFFKGPVKVEMVQKAGKDKPVAPAKKSSAMY